MINVLNTYNNALFLCTFHPRYSQSITRRSLKKLSSSQLLACHFWIIVYPLAQRFLTGGLLRQFQSASIDVSQYLALNITDELNNAYSINKSKKNYILHGGQYVPNLHYAIGVLYIVSLTCQHLLAFNKVMETSFFFSMKINK